MQGMTNDVVLCQAESEESFSSDYQVNTFFHLFFLSHDVLSHS